MIIILNGPSAAGKSSIQKEFQKLLMPQLWIKVGIDSLFDQPMPDIDIENMEYWQKENPIRHISTGLDTENNRVITLHVGEKGQAVMRGMNRAIAAYAHSGCNVIVDYIGYAPSWIEDLRAQLVDLESCWVRVDVPLEVLEERETLRGTSPKGHARSHFTTVYGSIPYDLAVNSHKHSALEIAQQIKQFLKL